MLAPEKIYHYIPGVGFPIYRNLYEDAELGIENMNTFVWNEIWNFSEFNSNGCVYEVGGLRVKENDIVVDVGANIGLWTNRAIQCGAKKVVAFEPVRNNYGCLLLNTFNNIKVETFNLAISDKISSDYINTDVNFSQNVGASVLNENFQYGRLEKIVTVTIDWLFDIGLIEKIDILKLDCEGSEQPIIFNISQKRLKKINSIVMEYHENLSDIPYSYVVDYLNYRGFRTLFQLHVINTNTKIITLSKGEK